MATASDACDSGGNNRRPAAGLRIGPRGRCRRTAACGWRGRPGRGARRPARSGTLQGRHQGPDAVRRPPPGHPPQPWSRRLDRGAARGGRLSHRAAPLHLRSAAAPARRRCRHPPRRRWPAESAGADPDRRAHGTQRTRSGRQLDLRLPPPDRRRPRSPGPAGRGAAGAQPRGADQRRAVASLLHQGRSHAPRRDVHPVYCTKVGATRPDEMARTWTAMDSARPPTTTRRARRW